MAGDLHGGRRRERQCVCPRARIHPRLARFPIVRSAAIKRIGDQALFYWNAVAAIPYAIPQLPAARSSG